MIAPTTLYTPTTLPDAAARVVAILRYMGYVPRWVVQRSMDGQLVRSRIHPASIEGVVNSVRFWQANRFTIELKTSGYVTVQMSDTHVNLDGWLPGDAGRDFFPRFSTLYYSERDF